LDPRKSLGYGDQLFSVLSPVVLQYPSLIKNSILTPKKKGNNTSIYGVIMNVRGKPWTIAVDDFFL
jgi:hypothetical protein